MRLLHLGNVMMDLVLTVPALPERGGDVVATGSRSAPGGGFNVMAAAARQGLPVTYAGAHGSGPFGDRARAALREEGIDVLLAPRPERDTGFVVCLVDAEGERTFVTSPGAEATLRPTDLAQLRPEREDLVYLSGYGLLYEANRAALTAWVPQLDPAVTLIVDPGPLVRDIPADALQLLMARADWWSCNAREAALHTKIDDPAAAAGALRSRLKRGSALVRTGPDGCLLHHDGTLDVIPGFAVRPVDLNGAGDAHTGVFMAALAHGLAPAAAARRANAAAAMAVTVAGPATAPGADALDAFLRQSRPAPR
ncbi:PfkB family carbohydrate kinase [Streptomyces sp. NPDC048415]|uniref:PfkB family carbohydrate kinase n=1 Tax=Streptomyces sp. NPDC048415 TaxID=3154822 RepID=UPI0034215CB4